LTNTDALLPPDEGAGTKSSPGEVVRSHQDRERLLLFLTARLINCRFEKIDEAIQDAMKAIGEYLRIEKIALYTFTDVTRERVDTSHSWFAEGLGTKPRILNGLELEGFPWLKEKLHRLDYISIPRVAGFPEEARTEKKLCEAMGIQSVLMVPLVHDGSLAGVLSVSTLTRETPWPEETTLLLRAAGEVVAAVLERKRRDTALRQRREEFLTLFDMTPIPTVVVDSHSRIHRANAAAQKFLSQPEAAIIGKNVGAAFRCRQGGESKDERGRCPECASCALYQAIQETLRTHVGLYGVETDLEIQLADDFEWRSIQSSTAFLETKGSARVIISLQDIAERRRAEESIQRTLSLLRATLESTADGILVVDSSGKIVTYNERFLEMWQIPREIMAPRDDKEVLAFVLGQLKDPQQFLGRVQEIYAAPEEESTDLIEFTDSRVFERFSMPQRLEDVPVGRVWNFRDVTDRRRWEEVLVTSSRQWWSTFNAMQEPVFLLDTHGKIVQCNKATAELLGKSRDEIIGRTCWELVHSSSTPIENCPVMQSIQSGRRETLTLQISKRRFEVIADPVFDEQKNCRGHRPYLL
jgi:PAS domain S-box-containing protein